MQVGIGVKFMYTDFGGRDLTGFRDITTLKKGQFFPFGPWSSKNLIN